MRRAQASHLPGAMLLPAVCTAAPAKVSHPAPSPAGSCLTAGRLAPTASSRARTRIREQRYAARQTHERASVTVDRLQRRVGELSERLDRMQPLLCLGVSPARVSL